MSTETAHFSHNPEKIAFLTDSCADLSPKLRKNKPVFVVPLHVRCADGEFRDGENIFAQDVYRRQQQGEMPHTSLPDGGCVDAVLDKIAALGYEKVAAVHLSSGLSGTCNLVRIKAAERTGLDVRVFDSLSGSLGLGATVLQAWEDVRAGMPWRELVEARIPRLIENTFPFFSVDTLEYLQKGGRIGKITAIAGTMLNIKPLISFAPDGQLASVAKVRGRQAVQPKFLELLAARMDGHTRYNLAVANGGAPQEMEALAKRMKAAFPNYTHFWQAEIDATLSSYIGAGVLGAGIQFLD